MPSKYNIDHLYKCIIRTRRLVQVHTESFINIKYDLCEFTPRFVYVFIYYTKIL